MSYDRKLRSFALTPEQTREYETLLPGALKWARIHAKRAYTRDPDAVESAAMDSLLRAVQNYRPGRGPTLRTYALATVRFRMKRVSSPMADYHRRVRARGELPALAHPAHTVSLSRWFEDWMKGAVDPALKDLEGREEADALRRDIESAIDHVHPHVRAVYDQRMRGEYSYETGAAALGLTVEKYRARVVQLKQIATRIIKKRAQL